MLNLINAAYQLRVSKLHRADRVAFAGQDRQLVRKAGQDQCLLVFRQR